MVNKNIYILIASATIIYGCTTSYTPPSTTSNANLLVVEGVINTGADSTIVYLSRTVIIASKTTANPETKATITVENTQGTVGTLSEIVKGTYASKGLNLDNTKQYRLRIKTSNGQTYLSDLVDARVTPLIDSIGYTVTGKGIQLYANSHDPSNNTRYYKYTFGETWQFHSDYQSTYITNGTAIVPRSQNQQIYFCYGRDSSTTILINSTAALSQDVVNQFPITAVDSTSEKIETKYSILLTQQALTKDAYTFWGLLKKNTEQLGSIFDAQPSQLTGNIHNVSNPSEPVIGYISAGTLTRKRIFISRPALPLKWSAAYPYTCILDTNYYQRPAPNPPLQNDVLLFLIPLGSIQIPTTIYGTGFFPTGGFFSSDAQCVDCTVRGHTQQPAFWK
jgi:hypothetical protein